MSKERVEIGPNSINAAAISNNALKKDRQAQEARKKSKTPSQREKFQSIVGTKN
jgi:hypothetical protein